MMRRAANMEMIAVHYANAIASPRAVAERISRFVGGGLDAGRMAAVVDATLYRNRVETLDPATS
jgi:hypothetical protein